MKGLCRYVIVGLYRHIWVYNDTNERGKARERNPEMTNAEIIRINKALNGITEDAHTYAYWKTLGYKVRKGEHAAFKCTIWKARNKKTTVDGEEKETVNMFMKTAHFFTRSQVDKIA